MIFPKFNPSLPPIVDMDEYEFQLMCCDLFAAQPEISTCDVYGTRGQAQQGIDLLAYYKGSIYTQVGQCKCYQKFQPYQIREASDEFFKHLDFWLPKKVQKFILFVACDLMTTQQQEMIRAEKERFDKHGIQYEAWSASTLRQRLAPHREIVFRYTHSHDLIETICGPASQPALQPLKDSRGTEFVIGVLSSKVDRLSSDLSKAKAQRLEEYKELYRQGQVHRAFTYLESLRDDENWDVFDRPLQAQILQSLSVYALSIEQDIEKAKTLAEQAQEIDPDGNITLVQVLIQYYVEGAEAALGLINSPANLDLLNLELGLLLELGRTDEVFAKLQDSAQTFKPDAETNRIHALALLEQGNISEAQVKIQQARYDKPDWENIRAAEATINYFSAFSPAVLSQLIDLPFPIEWSFVKRDDESLGRLRTAAKGFSQLAAQTERGEQQCSYWTIWYLACLANDPDRQAEAQETCATLLNQDPTHPHVIIWTTVRHYKIDLAPSTQALELLAQKDNRDLERIVALLGIYLHLESPKPALDLLNQKKEIFEQTKYQEVWLFWHVQALSLDGQTEKALQEVETFSSSATRRSLHVTILREQARVSNNWQDLAECLEAYWYESGNGQYLYEACQLQASLQNWMYVADNANDLINSVATSEALSLAAQATSQANLPQQCYQLLNEHRELFPSGILPPYLRRLRARCQAQLGFISQAIADIEELTRSQETVENLVMLMNLQVGQGDLRGLANTAVRLLRHEHVHPTSLLRAARYLLSEDRNLVRQLWQRAVTKEIDIEVLGEVITLGYSLGIEQDVQPFVHRAQRLALSGEGPFRAVSIQELLSLQREWIDNSKDINQKYESADLPIHVIAQSGRFALTSIFRVLLKANAIEPNLHRQPAVFIRYGARPFPEKLSNSANRWRLHLDISAFLLAAHLGILDKIEHRFSPLRVSPTLPTALLQECEYFLQHQPSRLENYREIVRLHQLRQLQELPPSLTPSSRHLVEKLGEQSAVLLEQAHAENGFVVELLPLERLNTNSITQPVVLDESDQQRIISCRSLVEVLKEEGILSITAYESALSYLGDQRDVAPLSQLPTRNDALFVSSELANLLASSDLFTKVCRYFRVFVTAQCISEAQAVINESEKADEVVQWLRELMWRVSTGLEQGKYETIAAAMPESNHTGEVQQSWDANGLTAYDLFDYQPQEHDVIWIDDRFFSKYPYRDSRVPVIGILEILEALRGNQDLGEPDYYEKVLQLRASNVRYIPITSQEVIYHLKQAHVKNNKIQETEDLVIFRSYVASCLLDSHRLQRPPMPQGDLNPDGEMMFVLECFRATQDAMTEIWADDSLSEEIAITYSDWILFNLYTGMFGVRHLLPNHDLNSDGLSLLSNDICSLYFRGMSLWSIDSHGRNLLSARRQAYFRWLEHRVTKKRLKANPEIISAVSRLVGNIILDLGGEQSNDESQKLLQHLMLKQFYQELPDILQAELNTDSGLMAYLQIEMVESINLTLLDSSTNLVFPTLDFLPAIATAINGSEAQIVALDTQRTFRIRAVHPNDETTQLHFVDDTTSTTFAWCDEVMLLASNNPSIREQVLRANRDWFDCDRFTYEKVVSEIVSTTDLRRSIDQVNQWRKESAALFYESFEQKLYQNHGFDTDDLIPLSGGGLLRHFHLDQGVAESTSFQEILNQAAASMLAVKDLEICLERFFCLPVQLPTQLREAFFNLLPDQRRNLLEQLASQLTSPVCQLHLLGLALNSHTSVELGQNILNQLLDGTGELQFRLFRAILRLIDSEFSYWQETWEWSSSVRLALIWAHTNKLYNLLYNPEVIVEKFVRELEEHTQARQISADILDRNVEFWNDILHPHRISRMRFVIHGVAAVVKNCEPTVLKAIGISEKLTTFATVTLEEKPFLNLELWHDVSMLAQDKLGALFRGTWQEVSSCIGDELSQQVAPDYLESLVDGAISSLTVDPLAKNQWLLITAIIGDLPIYGALIEKLSYLISELKFIELYRAEPMTALTALMLACDHAANTVNEDLRSKLETELIEIAALTNTQGRPAQVDRAILDHVLECALRVTLRADDSYMTSYALNDLFKKIADACPQFAVIPAAILSRGVLDLPTSQLYGAWTTNLLMRALRGIRN